MTRRTRLIVRGVTHLIASAIFGVIGADLVGQGGTGWTIVGVWCSVLAVIALALGSSGSRSRLAPRSGVIPEHWRSLLFLRLSALM